MPSVIFKIRNMPRLDIPRFTRSEMREIGEAVKDAEVERIGQAKKPDGSSADPLKVVDKNGRRSGYAIYKTRKTGRNKRDWNFTGAMLASLRVTVSDPARAVIKFSADQVKKAAIREAADGLFDLSEAGRKAGSEVAQKYWDKAVKRLANFTASNAA